MIIFAAGQPFSADAPGDLVRKGIDAAFPGFVEGVLTRAGITQTRAADLAGVARQTFADVLAGERRFSIGYLYRLPLEARIPLAQDLLGPTHGIVELPGEDSAEHDLGWFARSSREVVDAVSSAIEAAADGKLTRTEGAKLEVLCDRGISILMTIRELARQATREGVVGLGSKPAARARRSADAPRLVPRRDPEAS